MRTMRPPRLAPRCPFPPTSPATSSAASSPDRTLLVTRDPTSFIAAACSPKSSPAQLPSVVGPDSSEIPSTAGLAAQIANACIAAAVAKVLATHSPTLAGKEISDVDCQTGAPPASAAGHIEVRLYHVLFTEARVVSPQSFSHNIHPQSEH